MNPAAKSRPFAALATAGLLFAAGCVESDPPALDGGPTDRPAVTSDTLPRCPADGAPTSPAGCLDQDGNVVPG